MSNSRRRFSASQKVAILREILENDVPISTICERYNVHPNNIYRWKKQLFEGALTIFSTKQNQKDQDRLQRLESKLKDRDQVISEIVRENIELKKSLNGEL